MTTQPLPESFDLGRLRDRIAAAVAQEETTHALLDALRASGSTTPDADALSVRRAIETVPERLAAIHAAPVSGVARERVSNVVRAILAYWDDPDDVIADRLGLLGLIDDALVCHALLDRLNKWHIASMGSELVSLPGQPDLELRRAIDDKTDALIQQVVRDIWLKTEFAALEPAAGAAEGLRSGERARMRELRDSPPAMARATRAKPPAPSEPEDAPRLFDIWFGTNRKPIDPSGIPQGFGSDRDDHVHYGVCEVAIPKSHKFGSTGTPWFKRWVRLDFADDHIKIVRRRALDDKAAFLADLREELTSSTGKQVLFYLHGFNVSFDAAAIRAAQLFADLKVPGAAAFFSWPSKASLDDYPADLERVGDSEADIAAFLISLATELGGATVHIIAHSMGNRGLARAIQRITATAARDAGIKFGQIILAAPDLSVTLFRDLAAIYPALSQRTTMYVSARDRALGLSKWLQDAPRAGFTPPITVVPNIDTIEVTNIDVTLLGHGYYAEAAPVLYDIGELLEHGTAPDRRKRLQRGPLAAAASPYWLIGA